MIQSMIFFPEKQFYEKPETYGFDYEEVWLETKDRARLFGWYLKANPEKGTVLFFHGNAGNISGRLEKAAGWVERGYSVFLIDYRGYGKSEGSISHQDDVLLDAHAALAWLLDQKKLLSEKIILYGESLGSYPAVRLASESKFAGIILEAPFTSLYDVAKAHYPFIIKAMMVNFEFSNARYIGHLKSPLFLLHGTEDEICPYSMAGELIEKAPEPKGFLSVPGGMHNNLLMAAGDDYWNKPLEFIRKQAGD